MRAVIVLNNGWMFAGDVREESGRIYLTSAVTVEQMPSVPFASMISDPTRAKIRTIDALDIPAHSEIFRIPVSENWGLPYD